MSKVTLSLTIKRVILHWVVVKKKLVVLADLKEAQREFFESSWFTRVGADFEFYWEPEVTKLPTCFENTCALLWHHSIELSEEQLSLLQKKNPNLIFIKWAKKPASLDGQLFDELSSQQLPPSHLHAVHPDHPRHLFPVRQWARTISRRGRGDRP